jgi:hypothetical protein
MQEMTDHHFVQQYAQRPPVDCLGITLALQKLWSDVFWGAAKG